MTADPLTATGRTLRWGVVSTGSIARRVTPEIQALADAEVVAVSSRDQARAAAFAADLGISRAYGDEDGVLGYLRLAADPDVEVVYVATPHGQHHEVTKALLEAGKHVLVEKSFTINAAEAEDLVATARKRGVFLMEAVWTRFLPAYRRTLEILKSGEIGEVRFVQADLAFIAATDGRDRLWTKEAGGGALLDLAVYPLTWVIGALGFPESVHATGKLNRDGVDETVAMQLDYAGGAKAQVLVSFVSQSTRQARICGTGGTIVTDAALTRPEGLTVTSMTGTVGRGEATSRHEHLPCVAQPYAYQLREVTRRVQQGASECEQMPLDDTLRTMRLLDEVRRQIGLVYPNDARTT